MRKGFTLIELLIVLALISILAGILIVVIKPQEIFARARDSQRTGDLTNVAKAMDAYIADITTNPNIPTVWPASGFSCSSTVSFSASMTSNPPGWATSSPSGVTSVTGTPSTALNGTGWVKVPLASSTLVNLPSLPLDPLNSVVGGVGYFYNFTCGSDLTYELDAKLEKNTYAMQNDGGNNDNLYEVGSNKGLY